MVKQQPMDIGSLFADAGQKLVQSTREPNILMYQPHEKQEHFHRSVDYARLYMGGNRSGKTYGAVIEDIWWATDTHPYRETPPAPVRGRVVGVDFKWGVQQILLPMFKRLTAPSMLRGGNWDEAYSKSENVLYFSNGSTIEFMSYDQDTDKFAGTSRHFVHFDEEPPKHVFDECIMRIADTEGSFWISMTPVEGITWLFDTLYTPVDDAEDKEVIVEAAADYGQVIRSDILETTIVEVDQNENPYLSKVGRDRAMRTLTPEDRIARKQGKFVEMHGLVYKTFNPAIHVVPSFTPPLGWDWYMSIDYGWNNPTAVLWHAVAPNGDIYTFAEHYKSEMTLEEHATTILLREQLWGKEPELRTGDPAMKQTNGITGTSVLTEFANRGIYLSVEGVPRPVEIGVARIQQYLRVNPHTQKPRWFITEDCVNLIREMRRLRWKKYASKKSASENNKSEQIHKKDDHAYSP